MMRCLAMTWPGDHAWLPILTFVGVMIVGIGNTRQRTFHGKEYFLLAHLAMMAWLGAVTLEIFSPTADCHVFWAAMAWPGIALLPAAWTFFIYHYAFSIARKARPIEAVALVLMPVLLTALALANGRNGLFYTSTRAIDLGNSGIAIEFVHGPVFDIALAYLYLLLAFAFGVLFYGLFKAKAHYRMYFALPICIMAMAFLPNIAYNFLGFKLMYFDPTPFSFFAVVVAFSLLIASNRVFEVAAIASELIFARLRSPALIADAAGRLITANPAAQAAFAETMTKTKRRLSDWAVFAGALSMDGDTLSVAPGARITAGDRLYDIDSLSLDKPLARNGEPIAVVLLFNDITEQVRRYAAIEHELEQSLRALADSSLLQARLRESAEIDPLTHVRNRRSLPATFERFLGIAAREKRPLVMALIDIDHFKRWNDSLGHAVGDDILRDFAAFLEAETRPSQPVFRIGGEEFLILFADASMNDVIARVDGMRRGLRLPTSLHSAIDLPLTFSTGIAQWPADGSNLDAVLAAADKRLYVAKGLGRDRTIAI